MNLEVRVSDDVSYDDIIINALSMVAGKNDCSVILSKSEMTYIQTDGATLEHQEGSLDYHYYCPDSLSLDHMVEAFQSYARGDDWWKTEIRWEGGFYVPNPD